VSDLAGILEACNEAQHRGTPAVLATVVRVAGSAYRRPGARMLFRPDHPPVGLISGGCLEEDLALRSEEVLQSGQTRTVIYDMRSPDDIVWGLGLGCDGEVRVLLERIDASTAYLDFLQDCRRRREPGVLATLFEVEAGQAGPRAGDRLALRADGGVVLGGDLPGALREAVERDARQALVRRKSFQAVHSTEQGSDVALLVEYVSPVVSLLVCGAGMDAVPVVDQAKRLGWLVTVADHRPAYASRERFPLADRRVILDYGRLDRDFPQLDSNSPALVMTHHFLHDLDLLERLLPSAAPYVGALGPRRRARKLLEQLRARGLHPTPDQLDRFHGPVGIDLAAETPEEIALSALAEIQAVLHGGAAGFLRDREGPLHEPS
jgi:xanthine/CO dehydrogenase XdhC/CoxF family maturation factor